MTAAVHPLAAKRAADARVAWEAYLAATGRTAQDFIDAYAARGNTTPEALYERGRVVVTCGPGQRCHEPDCPGWACVSRSAYEEDAEFYNWTLVLPAA